MKEQWTGERLETFITNESMLEHLHRYAVAMEFTKGKKVLDIACGEGYGVHLLAKNASHVTGIDIDEPTIKAANNKYTAPNIIFKIGSVVNIPADDKSFEVITCFETIEHINEHQQLLSELKRVLATDGILFISTPEKLNYSDISGYNNPFHQKELYGDEFKNLLTQYFVNTSFFGQISFIGSLLINEQATALKNIYTGNYEHIEPSSYFPTMYWFGIASNNTLPSLNSSIFHTTQTIERITDEQTKAVHKTVTYRTGNFILSPFKFIYSLLKK